MIFLRNFLQLFLHFHNTFPVLFWYFSETLCFFTSTSHYGAWCLVPLLGITCTVHCHYFPSHFLLFPGNLLVIWRYIDSSFSLDRNGFPGNYSLLSRYFCIVLVTFRDFLITFYIVAYFEYCGLLFCILLHKFA